MGHRGASGTDAHPYKTRGWADDLGVTSRSNVHKFVGNGRASERRRRRMGKLNSYLHQRTLRGGAHSLLHPYN